MAAVAAPIVRSSTGVAPASSDTSGADAPRAAPPLNYYTDYAAFVAAADPNAAYVYPDGRVARKKSDNPQDGLFVTDKNGVAISPDKIAQENSDRSGFDVGIAGIPTDVGAVGAGGLVGLVANGGADRIIGAAKDAIGGIGGGGVNTSAVQPDIDRARSLSQQFADAYTNFQPATAPTVAQTTLGPQRDAVAGQVGNVPQVVAPNVGGPQQVQGATVGQFLGSSGAGATGGVATAGVVGPIERAIAERAAAERATAEYLDPTKQAEFREKQNTLLGYLTGAIDGTAPSVAQLQLDQATQRNASNQLGLASAASRGGNSALALRTAANNIGYINQKAAADAALLRAQEIATARGQYGDVASQGRTGDLTLADRNATLGTGVSQTNAALGTDVSKTNATLGTHVNETNAANDLAAQTANANNVTQANVATAGNATQASVASANNATQSSIANSNNSLAAQIAQAKLTQEASTSNATNATTLQALQAQLLYNASHDNAGNALSAEQTNANLATQASTTNATNATNLNIKQGEITNSANIANAGNAVTTAGQDVTRQQNAAGNALTGQGQVIQGNANVLDNQTKSDIANTEAKGRIAAAAIGGIGSAGTALLGSDERIKTDVKDGDADAQALLDHLKARSFRYINPKHGGGPQTGVMAKDVEKTRAGRSFVRETSEGKALDAVAGFGSVLAMLSTLNERVKKVEGARAA